MSKRMKRKVLNFANTKSLLRVRGLAEMDDVPYWENKVLECVKASEDWRKETVSLDFVLPVLNISKSITIPNYKNPKPRTEFHRPYLVWRHVFINGQGSRIQNHYQDWHFIQIMLDETNASLDERQLHYRAHMTMKDINMQARIAVEGLRQSVFLLEAKEELLKLEHIKITSLPDEIQYAQN